MKFNTLNSKIYERGIKKSVIAKALGITEKTLQFKIKGERPFTWEQACKIQSVFFPDVKTDSLFSQDNPQKTA